MWHDHKEGWWAVLPVASLWASSDYKSVANLPIRVSQILYLILLIFEINEKNLLESHLHLGKEISYHSSKIAGSVLLTCRILLCLIISQMLRLFSNHLFPGCPNLWMNFPEEFLLGHELNFLSHKVHAHLVHKSYLACSQMTKTTKNYIVIRKDCFQVKSNLLTVDNLVFHF